MISLSLCALIKVQWLPQIFFPFPFNVLVFLYILAALVGVIATCRAPIRCDKYILIILLDFSQLTIALQPPSSLRLYVLLLLSFVTDYYYPCEKKKTKKKKEKIKISPDIRVCFAQQCLHCDDGANL